MRSSSKIALPIAVAMLFATQSASVTYAKDTNSTNTKVNDIGSVVNFSTPGPNPPPKENATALTESLDEKRIEAFEKVHSQTVADFRSQPRSLDKGSIQRIISEINEGEKVTVTIMSYPKKDKSLKTVESEVKRSEDELKKAQEELTTFNQITNALQNPSRAAQENAIGVALAAAGIGAQAIPLAKSCANLSKKKIETRAAKVKAAKTRYARKLDSKSKIITETFASDPRRGGSGGSSLTATVKSYLSRLRPDEKVVKIERLPVEQHLNSIRMANAAAENVNSSRTPATAKKFSVRGASIVKASVVTVGASVAVGAEAIASNKNAEVIEEKAEAIFSAPSSAAAASVR